MKTNLYCQVIRITTISTSLSTMILFGHPATPFTRENTKKHNTNN